MLVQFHVFNSALCLGTLVLRDARNDMAPFALEQIGVAVALFTSLTQHGANTPRYRRNLQWLQKLHTKASKRISEVSANKNLSLQQPITGSLHRSCEEREETDEVELLGWRTRLVERVGQGRPSRTTIHPPATPAGSLNSNPPTSVTDQNNNFDPNQLDVTDLTMPHATLPLTAPDPIDDLVSTSAKQTYDCTDICASSATFGIL